MRSAMVLCAGYGTRLRPLTDEVPKPLVPIGDRPLLVHIAEKLRSAGFEQIVINTHHLPHEFCNALDMFRVKAQVLHETEILGTAGGVAHARRLFGATPILVWNGDILADPPVETLLAAASAGGFALAAVRLPAGQGTLGVSDEGNVVRLRGQRFGQEAFGGDYIGVAALGVHTLSGLPHSGCLIGDVALPALARGECIRVVWTDGSFSDAGDLGAYHALNMEWLRRTSADFFVGARAVVAEGVSLSQSILGAGACAVGTGCIERSVVWPGATATAPLRDSIVMRSGRVVPITGSRAPS